MHPMENPDQLKGRLHRPGESTSGSFQSDTSTCFLYKIKTKNTVLVKARGVCRSLCAKNAVGGQIIGRGHL